MERWAIHIDMEGFSILWDKEDQVLRSLGELMRAIFRIGRECFPDSPERLFAHQLGDGYLIVSDFGEESLERAVTVAVALMRHVAASGRLTKTAVAEGDLSDIQGCYPAEIRNELDGDYTVSLGMGLMTVFPVMGTALIRSVKVAKKSPRGPLLIVEQSKADRIPAHIPLCTIPNTDLLSVDWIHLDTELLSRIQTSARLAMPGAKKLEGILADYCAKHDLPKEWIANVGTYLGVRTSNAYLT